MTNVALLEQKIRNCGQKKCHLANALSLTPQGFGKKLRGETEFKLSEVEKLCECLGITTASERDRIFFAK